MKPITIKRLTAELIECAAKTSNSTQKKQHQQQIAPICYELAKTILANEYQPSSYTHFAVTDPKLREIYAPSFKDRLVQCWVVKYAEPLVERHLIEDTFANRKQKGTLKAIERAQHFMRKAEHHYYLQLDIQAFFNSIHRPTLNALWQGYLSKFSQSLGDLYLFLKALSAKIILHQVIDSPIEISGDKALLLAIPTHKQLRYAAPDCGLPIGSVTSQLFANFYLSTLDHFVKHSLKEKGYCRYMDDIVLFSNSPKQLALWRNQIAGFLKQELKLTLHPTKQHIGISKQGMRYLGYELYPHYRHVKTSNIAKFRRYLCFFNQLLTNCAIKPLTIPIPDKRYWQKSILAFNQASLSNPNNPTNLTKQSIIPLTFLLPYLKQMQAVINSYLSLLIHGEHYALRKQLFHDEFKQLKHYFLPNDYYYSSVRLKQWVLVVHK